MELIEAQVSVLSIPYEATANWPQARTAMTAFSLPRKWIPTVSSMTAAMPFARWKQDGSVRPQVRRAHAVALM